MPNHHSDDLGITVKSDVLFPAILQHCHQYCNVHAVTAPSKLQRCQFQANLLM